VQLLGTNKFASCFGTTVALIRYYRTHALPLKILLVAAGTAFCFSFLGAYSVSILDPSFLRPLVIVALALVLIYTVSKPTLGASCTAPLTKGKKQKVITLLVTGSIGGVLGFYDGFFGPGAGSFMLVALITLLGFDFIRASTLAKMMNVATNLAALAYFIPNGNVNFKLGFAMATANIIGSIVGAHLALTKGARFVRLVLITVVVLLLSKQVTQLIS
jgi:uncharacterized membrane protein YfcA